MICVVGAGLSIDAGVPGIAGLQQRIERRFRGHPEHDTAYRVAREQVKEVVLSGRGTSGRQRSGAKVGNEPWLEELIDVLNSGGELPDTSPGDKSRLRKAVMAVIGESLNVAGTNPGPPGYYVRLIERALRRWRTVHIFSVNFDLCVELLTLLGYVVETGFGGYGPGHPWEKARFLHPVSGAQVFLYKLHGSMNWRIREDGRLCSLDPRGFKDIEEARIVLGRRPKEAGEFPEPYWFCQEHLLEVAPEVREIWVLGYSFHDDGVNAMLGAFVAQRQCDRVVVLSKFPAPPGRDREFARIREILRGNGRVVFISGTAEKLSRGGYDRLLCPGPDSPGP